MKNPDLRIEYRVYELGELDSREILFADDSEENCIQWILDHTPVGLMSDVSFIVQKVYTTSRKA